MNMPRPFGYVPVKEQRQDNSSYGELEATELYCPKCKKAVPVIKSLLLVLPSGDKYEYRCAFCASSVGTKIDKKQKPPSLAT